jgi:hypothetical protein
MTNKAKKTTKKKKTTKASRLAQRTLSINANVSTGGPQYLLGVGEPSGWQPSGIYYYKLGLSTQGGLRFQFLSESGYLRVTNTAAPKNDLKNLIVAVMAGQIPQPGITPFVTKPHAPHFIVYEDCYVVVELDNSVNWRFLYDAPAVTIGPNYVPDDGTGTGIGTTPQAQYFGLNHIDTDGLTTSYEPYDGGSKRKYGIAPPINRVCQLIHFGIRRRTFDSTSPEKNIDRFNIYLEIDHGFGDFLPIILDPDIKNEGGSNPYTLILPAIGQNPFLSKTFR